MCLRVDSEVESIHHLITGVIKKEKLRERSSGAVVAQPVKEV